MKSFNTTFRDYASLEKFVSLNSIAEHKNILIQVFSGIIDEATTGELAQNIKALLPQANIVGVTTAGEIFHGKILECSIVISFSIFDSTHIKSKMYDLTTEHKIEDAVNELVTSDTKAMIIFSDGLKSNAEQLIRAVYALKPEIVIAGGRAGDNFTFDKTYVFDESAHTQNGYIIATLSGDELHVNSDYILNWTPIGKDMIVTKAKGNTLYELDGMPIYDVYKKYLGDDVIDNFPQSSMEFPLTIKKDNILVARDPLLKTDDNALMFAGNFEEGDIVRFSFGNIEDIEDEAIEYFERFKAIPAESIFIYSCAARKSLMGDKLEDEINILESLAPASGFFTYGEYFHTSNIAEILNVTTTFLALSESPLILERNLKKHEAKGYDVVKKVLTHLIKVTTKELEHISTHDILTSMYNRVAYIKKLGIMIKSAERYGETFGLVMLDIDHFKLINDNYGHFMGDNILKDLAEIFVDNVRKDDLIARWGGEEFMIIAKYATMEDLELLVQNLQKKIAEHSFYPVPRVTLSFGLSVYMEGDNEDSIFKRVDNAMYTAKQNGRNTYVIG